ncbi:MAG: hypothetical protein IKP32_04445 [Clostridia bacterium]|nr:hypothetical protein [Clostridia bacterium]
MEIRENTRLADLLAAYPWLPEAAVKIDDRLKIVNTPLGRMLIKKYTIADISKRTGYAAEDIIREIQKVIDEHAAPAADGQA